jgi:hypothetical protein
MLVVELAPMCLNSLVTEDVRRCWLAPMGLATEVTPVKLIMPTHGDWLVKGCAESRAHAHSCSHVTASPVAKEAGHELTCPFAFGSCHHEMEAHWP